MKDRFVVDEVQSFDRLETAVMFAKTQAKQFEFGEEKDGTKFKIFTPSIILDTKTKLKHVVKFRPTKGYRVFVL
jgi:hypothetical protein